MIEILYKSIGEIIKVDDFWLRDHCKCNECYNMETKQRRCNLLDIPSNVKALEVLNVNEDIVEVKWSDDHKSTYNLKFLYDAQLPQMISHRSKSTKRTLWNQEIVTENKHRIHFDLSNLISSEDAVRDLVSALISYGIIFIDGVPPNETMTEMAIRRIFPVMKTFFGEMYTFSDRNQDHADTAYTKLYLGSHTDNTYFCDAAGLQALHCIEHINGTGGENFFVDGLHAVQELKSRNPKAFHILTTVQVPAEYIEDQVHHKHSAPIIRLDPITGEVIQIRFNIYDRSVFNTIKQEDMKEFYDSLRELAQIIQDHNNQWTIKLNPGTIVIFDNWRTLHGRHAYTGQRTMTGCYVQRTDFMSKARSLGIIE